MYICAVIIELYFIDMNEKEYYKIRNVIVSVIIVMLFLCLSSCNFHTELVRLDLSGHKGHEISAEELVELCRGIHRGTNQTMLMPYENNGAGKYVSHDSVGLFIGKLVDDSKFTLNDYLYIRRELIPFKVKYEMSLLDDSIGHFFSQLDENKVPDKGYILAFKQYEKFLGNILENGIENEYEFQNFLKMEDTCFRQLLVHLSSWTSLPIDTIICKTNGIFDSCNDRMLNVIGERNLLLYLMLRNNRRIVQNACASLRQLEKTANLSEEQFSVYWWMTLRPFLSTGDYSFYLMLNENTEEMEMIVDKVTDIGCRFNLPSVPLSVDALVKKLIKLCVMKYL